MAARTASASYSAFVARQPTGRGGVHCASSAASASGATGFVQMAEHPDLVRLHQVLAACSMRSSSPLISTRLPA